MAYRYHRTFYGQQQEKGQLVLQLSAQLDALRMNQQDYVVLESQAEIIREKYAALQAEKERVKQSLLTKNELLERQLTDYQRQSHRLRNEVKLSKEQLEDTLAKRDELAAEVRRNQAAIEVLQKQKLVTVENGKTLEAERQELDADVAALKQDIAKWELLKAEYIDQIGSYKGKTEMLRKEITAAKQSDVELEQRIAKIQAQTKAIQDHTAKIEESVKTIVADNHKLAEQLKQQKTECIELQSQINRIGEETNHYERLLQFEEKKEKQLTHALNAANAALDQRQTELTGLKRRNEASREEQKSLEEENEQLERLYADLNKHLSNLAQQNAMLESELERVADEDRQIRNILNNKTMLLQPYHKENFPLHPKTLSQSRSTTGNCFSRTLDF